MEETPNKSDTGGSTGPEPVRLSSRRRMKNSTVGSPKSALDSHSVHGVIKTEMSDSQDEAPSAPAVAATSPAKKSAASSLKKTINAKRAIINVDGPWSSDEEDFAGFGECNGTNDRKKIKEEPLSDIESLGERSVKLEPEVKQEQDTEEDEDDEMLPPVITAPPAKRPNKIVSPVRPVHHVVAAAAPSPAAAPTTVVTPKNTKPAPISDPRYRKPFEFGWKRELVYRAHNDVHRKQYDKGEVYYITPAGKKLRTKTEILINLTEGLDANDFTFTREALGMGPEDEIIRSAKMHSAGKNRPVNFLDLGESDPMLGFGKRVPKPKAPKGASPTPMSAKNRGILLGQKKIDVLIDTPSKGGKPKAKSSAPTTGEDGTPPPKKRLLSRSASSKVQTPSSSPNSRIMSPAVSKIATMPAGIEKRPAASSASVQTLYAKDLFNQLSIGYDVLLHTFQYLKVQELLRASCVCRVWNQAAHNKALWRTVRMKNSKVNDFGGFVQTLKNNGTKHLDLRKMLLPSNNDESWQKFSEKIGAVTDLETIELCRLPAQVVEKLFVSNPGLRVINSVAIKDSHLNLAGVEQLTQLSELRLKSLNSMHIDSVAPLQHLPALRHLSLTSIKELGTKDIHALGSLTQLESLELGECSEIASGFAANVLLKLTHLERLRMEKGQDQCCTFEILDAVSQMPQLTQLELVNFDIKPEFDVHLERCQNVRRLLIIPTYISQSATTNHTILNGVLKLTENLEQLTLVVTLELLRVTELYVDQCDGKRRDRKQPEDKIPVLKPVPGMSDQDRSEQRTMSDVPQVEILPLEKVEKILATHLPNTKFSIIKVPYHATWRQSMVDLQ